MFRKILNTALLTAIYIVMIKLIIILSGDSMVFIYEGF